MPVWGTGPQRTDGQTNSQINATILYISSPNLISNLSFWFDATDNTTIQLQQGNSSNIYGWRSKGNFPILISTAATVAPAVPNNAVVPYTVPNGLNGRQTVFFPGISSILMTQSTCRFNSVATNNETTIFTVVNPINNNTIFAYENYFGNRCSYTLGSFFYGNYLYTTVNSIGSTSNVGYYQQTFYRRNSDSNQVIKFRGRLNNRGTNTLLMTANQTFALGGIPGPLVGNTSFPLSNPGNLIALTGNIAEVLLYNRGLTDDEIVSVEGYLAKKWGIQNQLLFNHVGVARNPPLMGYRLLPYRQVVSNYGLWFDAMDTSTIRDIGGNFPPRLPPNQLGIGRWNDKSGNNRFLSNYVERVSDFNLLGTNYYPTVVQRFTPGNPFSPRLRSQDSNNYYTGCNISAFFVLSARSNNFNDALLGFTSSFNAMPTPLTGDRLVTNSNSTFDFTLTYNSSNIGLSRFGANTINNVVSAPYTGAYSLVSIFVNGTQNTIGNVLPSTNMISINGAFVSSSSFYAGRNFNILYLSIFGGYNFTTRNTMSFNEIGVFYRTLTTAERVAYESQLIRKWSLPSNAPISYINNNPVTNGLYFAIDAYDPSFVSTTVTSDGLTRVDTVLDKSGNNRHFKFTTGFSNIFYNRVSTMNQYNSLYFSTGTTAGILSNINPINTFSTNSYSFFLVYNQLSTQTNTAARILGANNQSGSDSVVGGFSYQILGQTPFFVPREYQLAGGNIINGRNYLYSLVNNGGPTYDIFQTSTFYSYHNFGTGAALTCNINLASTNLLNISQFNIGGRVTTPQCFNGLISEVLCYNRGLLNSERLSVENYLINKWGISTLVSNVPVSSGLNLWLDAYDPSAVITDSNSNVLLWRDKSLFRRNFSNFNNNIGPPTYVAQGGNNLPSVSFNNAFNTNAGQGLINSNFFISSISSISIFMVKQVVTSATTSFPQSFSMYSTIGYSNGNNEFFIYEAPNGIATTYRRANQNYFNSVNNSNLSLASYIINSSNVALNDIPASNYGLVFNGVKVGPPVDGLTPSTFNTTIGLLGTNANNTFNNNTAYNGFINEVLYYNRALNFSERQQVESYLMSKWRI